MISNIMKNKVMIQPVASTSLWRDPSRIECYATVFEHSAKACVFESWSTVREILGNRVLSINTYI